MNANVKKEQIADWVSYIRGMIQEGPEQSTDSHRRSDDHSSLTQLAELADHQS